jgi:hypothetical protein
MSIRIRRAVVALCVVGVASIGPASAAAADAPDRGTRVNTVSGFAWFDCSTVIPGAGTILADGTSSIDWADFYRDGERVREAIHARFDGVLHGPRGDAPYEIVANRSVDPALIMTVEGRTVYHLPDRTSPLIEAGRAVLDLELRQPLRLTPHRDNVEAVCAAIG